MKNLVLKPSNRAVNHVYYPSSHQRNLERPNTANYCSCWHIQPQNHAASCQLLALTTVTTKAAIMTGSTDDSRVYLRFIVTVVPGAVSSSLNHPENRERNSVQHTASVCVLISFEQETIVLLSPQIKTGQADDGANFQWRGEVQRSRVQAEKKPDDQRHRLALVTIEKFRAGGISFWFTHPPNTSP